MHYSPTQYAEALLDLAKESAPSKRHEMVRDFLSAMERNKIYELIMSIIRAFAINICNKHIPAHCVMARYPARI